jgi:hypothetical protein
MHTYATQSSTSQNYELFKVSEVSLFD